MTTDKKFDFDNHKTVHKLKKMSLSDFEKTIKHAQNVNSKFFLSEMHDVDKLEVWIKNGGSLTSDSKEDISSLLKNISVNKLKFLVNHNYSFINNSFYIIQETLKKQDCFNYFLHDYPEKNERYFSVLADTFNESVRNEKKDRIAAIHELYSDKNIFLEGKNASFNLLDSEIIYFLYKRGIIDESDFLSQKRILFIQSQKLSVFEMKKNAEEIKIQDLKKFNSKSYNQEIKSLIVNLNNSKMHIAEIQKRLDFYNQIGGTPESLYIYMRDRFIEEQRSQLKNLFNQTEESNTNKLSPKRL